MKPFIRLTVLVLMSCLPLAGGPTLSHAESVPPPLVRNACGMEGACVCERAHVLIRAAHTTAEALGTAIRATAEALRRADRGRIAPGGRVPRNGSGARRTSSQVATPQGR